MLRQLSRTMMIGALFMAAGHLPAAHADAPAATKEVTVTILNFKFDADRVEVPVGTKVTWVNKDTTVHTVISKDKSFANSPGLDTDDNYSYVFTKAGTYDYYCSLHPFMTGKIVVIDKTGSQSGY